MTIISALELRNQLGEIIDRVVKGEEIIVKYRRNKQIKLTQVNPSTQKSRKGLQILEYFSSPTYKNIVRERPTNPLYNAKNPREEKENIRNNRAKLKLNKTGN